VNERIRALAEQALDYANSCEAEAWDGAYERKFAELIVQECLEVVEKQLGGGNGDGVEWDRAIDFTYEDMKKHFGVEQ
jgi:hypothetical protein